MLTDFLMLLADVCAGALQISLGLFAENAGEWLFHRYVLHGLGKRPKSLWNYHWSEHHRAARANQMLDPGYRGWPLRWNTQGKEALFLLLVAAAHLPLLAFAPLYASGMLLGLAVYYARHRRAHLDPEWAKANLPWHYEHHLSKGAEANWCISWPWFDWLMGTRVRTS